MRFINTFLLAAALTVPMALTADDHHDKRYYDRVHKDYHEWNDDESRFYFQFLDEHHRNHHDFAKANHREQDDYWKWRHDHR